MTRTGLPRGCIVAQERRHVTLETETRRTVLLAVPARRRRFIVYRLRHTLTQYSN